MGHFFDNVTFVFIDVKEQVGIANHVVLFDNSQALCVVSRKEVHIVEAENASGIGNLFIFVFPSAMYLISWSS